MGAAWEVDTFILASTSRSMSPMRAIFVSPNNVEAKRDLLEALFFRVDPFVTIREDGVDEMVEATKISDEDASVARHDRNLVCGRSVITGVGRMLRRSIVDPPASQPNEGGTATQAGSHREQEEARTRRA
eukprot:GHVU01045566.1.p1 GENE.GHVU01045566.1~~GHVU01045566.1.p1  ORF type:complete len:147 (-),score=13.81 GHVU01045566.1:396-785(-)